MLFEEESQRFSVVLRDWIFFVFLQKQQAGAALHVMNALSRSASDCGPLLRSVMLVMNQEQ